MRRKQIRDAFGHHIKTGLKGQFKIIWENMPATDLASHNIWIKLSIDFSQQDQPFLLAGHQNILNGQLSGQLSVPADTGTAILDSMYDELDRLLSNQRIGPCVTSRLHSTTPERLLPYYHVGFSLDFISTIEKEV